MRRQYIKLPTEMNTEDMVDVIATYHALFHPSELRYAITERGKYEKVIGRTIQELARKTFEEIETKARCYSG